MQEQIRSMIEQALRSDDRTSAQNQGNVAQALAGRTIRWAQLAASMHMVRSAQIIAQSPEQAPRPVPAQCPESMV